eukprot:GHVL01014612.1.p1 GENE.GHVL01014612.1~~GHVL01014612.1.p1  ORF type:complete len:836 (+),score=171.99 GHVL01014612.1:593-3100(+)
MQLKEQTDGRLSDVACLAIAVSELGFVQRYFQDAGIKSLRAFGNKIVSQDIPEAFDSQSNEQKGGTGTELSKFARDLCTAAENEELDPVVGRQEEVRRLIETLSRRSKNNPVLIGQPGVGKTAVVEGLAQRIVKGDVPDHLRKVRIWSLDLGAMIAGTSLRGQFEDRLKNVLKEVAESKGDIILFIDELHVVLGAGKAGDSSMDAANLLKPVLARGNVRIIGATTLDEYRKHVEKDEAFERRFQPIMVAEPTVLDSISILRGLKKKYEDHHGFHITDDAVVAAATLSDRYITSRRLPDKAIDLIDEACASVRVSVGSKPAQLELLEKEMLTHLQAKEALQNEKSDRSSKRLREVEEQIKQLESRLNPMKDDYTADKIKLDELNLKRSDLQHQKDLLVEAEKAEPLDKSLVAKLKKSVQSLEKEELAAVAALVERRSRSGYKLLVDVVDVDQICDAVSRMTGIPVNKLSKTDKEKILDLPSKLREKVVGQSEAVEAVSDAVLRSRAGLSETHKPLGSFLFMGPTGVGKTQLAKSLATELFDDEKHMIRFDMSEMVEAHSVSKLIGSPPGYVGYEQGGQLTEAVRRHPYSVLLFDEIEKAHPQVFNILLQVLDDGRLTDGLGRTVDFSNTVIVLTSNIGAQYFTSTNTDGETDMANVKAMVAEETKKHFRPEFINRLDAIVVFEPLNKNQLFDVMRLQLKGLVKRLNDQDMKLEVEDDALGVILHHAYRPEFGARPLQRFLEKHIVTRLSRMIVAGLLIEGYKVRVTANCKSNSPNELCFVVYDKSNKVKTTQIEKMDTVLNKTENSLSPPKDSGKSTRLQKHVTLPLNNKSGRRLS